MNILSILKIFKHGLNLILFDKKITDHYPFHVAKKILPKRYKGFLSVDLFKCNLCEDCLAFCPSNAISINKDSSYICIDYTKCLYCGNCSSICKRLALVFIDKFEAANTDKDIFTHQFYIKKRVY